jgi:hypothetical protein
MTLPTDTEPVLTRLESALDAGCAALVALQALPRQATPGRTDVVGVQRQLRHVTKLLRAAIDAVRAGDDEEPSLLAFGFVLDAEAAGGPPVQVTPRRTA